MQTRALTCTSNETSASHAWAGAENAGTLRDALSNANADDVVLGVSELYYASKCLVDYRMTGRLPPRCACGSRERARSPSARERHGIAHLDPVAFTPELQARLDDLTQTDTLVYTSVVLKVLDDILRAQQRTGVVILCPDEAATLVSETSYLPALQVFNLAKPLRGGL